MFGKLFSTKPDHPLADAKETRHIIATMLAREPAFALIDATGWFESLAGLDDFTPTLRLDRISELAGAVLPLARRHARNFLLEVRTSRLQQQQGWQRNQAFWTHLAQACDRCLEDADNSPKAAASIRPRLPALLAAALIAHASRLRWAQLRYGPIDGSYWQRLGQTYLRAVGDNVAGTTVRPFGPREEETSVVREYLKTLIFHASSPDTLPPLEIALAERFIAHCLPHFVISTTALPASTHWIDAAQALPPVRLTQPPEAMPTLRYFGPGAALEIIQQMRTRLTSGSPLDDINLGGQFAPELLITVLDHLSLCWSPNPPTRSHPRHRTQSRVEIIHGLPAIWAHLGGTETKEDVDHCEHWLVEDVSRGGMCTTLPLLHNDWVKINALLGVQPEGHDYWVIGTIRRFIRNSETHGTVGIETLSPNPHALTAVDGNLQTQLILLDPLQDEGLVRVLLALNDWEAGMALTIIVEDKYWRLYPQEKTETSEDWLIGRYLVELLPV